MAFTDIIIYISIALMYNILVHSLAATSYKDLQFKEKHINSIIMLILFGGIGILISKIINERNKDLQNSYVATGLYWGGILLLLTSIVASWNDLAEELKLIGIATIFGLLIWYGYNRDTKNLKKKEAEAKINEEIINELIPE